jgi:hypothetical protein
MKTFLFIVEKTHILVTPVVSHDLLLQIRFLSQSFKAEGIKANQKRENTDERQMTISVRRGVSKGVVTRPQAVCPVGSHP